MTSSPVMSSQIQNLANLMNKQVNTQKADFTDFKSYMNQTSNIKTVEKISNTSKPESKKEACVSETNEIKNQENEKPMVEAKETEAAGQTEQTEQPEEIDIATEVGSIPQEENIIQEKAEVITKAVIEIVDVMKEELDVSEEDIINAMETLGLPMVSLLEATNLPEIVAKVTDCNDTLSIATDENLYSALNKISEKVEGVVSNLSNELMIPVKEFKEIVSDLKNDLVTNEEESDISTLLSSELPAPVNEELTQAYEMETSQSADTVDADSKPKTFEEKITINVRERKQISYADNEVRTNEKEPANEIKVSLADSKQSAKFENSREQDSSPMQSFVQTILSKAEERLNEVANTETVYTSYDVEDIMNQITEFIKVDISEETQEVNLRLHPESLGTVNVRVSANNEGVLTASFTAQNESVKAIIESQAMVLREALEQKGVTIEAVEVLVQSHEFERNFNDQNRHEDNHKGSGRRTLRKIDLTEGIEDEVSANDKIVKEMMEQNGNTIDYSA